MTCLPRSPVALREALVSQLWSQYNPSDSCSKMGWATTSSRKISWQNDQVWETLQHHLQAWSPSFQRASGFPSAHERGFKHFLKFLLRTIVLSQEWQIYFIPCTRSCGFVAQWAGRVVLHSYLWVLQSRVTVNMRVYFWTCHSLPYVRHGWHLHFLPHSEILEFSV